MTRALTLAAVLLVLPGLARASFAWGPEAPPAYQLRDRGSVLAYPLVAGDGAPDLVLAQRTIERRWGLSEDSTYREINVPGWKSESGALGMSFVLPGAGQLYAGERVGYLFLLTEALGIYEVWALAKSGDHWNRQARDYAGNPADTTSRWSFETYEKRTGKTSAELRALYQADPGLFYSEIAYVPGLSYGWNDYGAGDASQKQFVAWRDNGQERLKRSRIWRAGLWANHLVSAVDALRAARLINVPLQRNLELHLKSGWGHGAPQVAAIVERKF